MRRLPALLLLLLCPGLAMAQVQHCTNFQPTRQPFFGELHVHTQYSMDAANLDTRNTPRDAYRFAKGEKVGIPPFVDTRLDTSTDDTQPPINGVSQHPYCLPPDRCQYTATRTIQFPPGRALDFAAITDHSEFFGETNICFFEGLQCTSDAQCDTAHGEFCSSLAGRCVPRGYDSINCRLSRESLTQLRAGIGIEQWGEYVLTENPQRFPFCQEADTCIRQARNVWQQIQAAANEAYERCTFTSFIGYEYTGQPGMGQCSNNQAPCFADQDCTGGATCTPNSGGGNNLHRNIIFRNDDVVDLPISYIEAPTGCGQGAACQHGGALASPQAMLQALKQQCLHNPAHPRCDAVSIPHNPNISGGAMFLLPETLDEANIRAEMEPLVELFQIKGGSECRFSFQHPGAWNTKDELCDFEAIDFAKLGGPFLPAPDATTILPNSFVRNVLKSGLQYQQTHGVNPFKLGFVGGTDNHNGTPSATIAAQYAKTGAHGDLSFAVSGQILNETFLIGFQSNPGGLSGVWAEENSRDAIFNALKRRETFATSGTRIIPRFFGGFALPENMCQRGDFAQQGYNSGVPMGGTLTRQSKDEAPRFAVSALMDPGWPGQPGTPLQRIQIIKGWVDAQGNTQEAVYDVAGDASKGTSVDLRTCNPTGGGFADLCAVWTDPDFNKNERAFYYPRVLESPSCRWNQYYCNARQVDCSRPPIPQDENPPYSEFEYQQCCSSEVPSTVQQRAWTSPIWYTP